MSRVVALIDGEHYPPVVRFALDEIRRKHELAAVAFVGGTEKIDTAAGIESYGAPVVQAADAEGALRDAIEQYGPETIIDLSDEPVLTAEDRFRLASIALGKGVAYEGADFRFEPPAAKVVTETPALGIIGTGKRVGKTAVSAYIARRLKSEGRDIVVLAMGRGGPAEPELIRGDEVALTTEDLLSLAAQGKHASSDNYEDAVMSRVTTVGCRRCGGGMAGETYSSNVAEGARLADSLGKDLVVLEGSGAAIPPVASDADILVVGAGQGVQYVRDYFGPYRLGRADGVIVAGAEEPVASSDGIASVVAAIRAQRQDVPIAITTFRPKPLADVSGKRVFFATTAPKAVLSLLVEHLESEYGCRVVGSSHNLSNRSLLREDMRASAGLFETLLTELKAAAIDVVAAVGAETGVPTVLCDNVPVSLDGTGIDDVIDHVAGLALERALERKGR